MNSLLQSISDQASEDLRNLIEDGAEDILAAIHKAQEEAQLQETSPKFNIGFKISVDFDKAQFDCDLSWSLKQSLSASHKIDDPNQGKLPMEDTDVAISAGGKSVKTTLGGLKRASRKLGKK